MPRLRLLFIIPVLALLCSCAAPRARVSGPTAGLSAQAPKGWWYTRFQIFWPRDSKPHWYVDAAIADRVIKPVVEQHKSEIVLWRLHRRATRDKAGHQLSFIFYSSKDSADAIYGDIRANPFLRQLMSSGAVTRIRYDDTSLISKPNIQDTSDPHWTMEVQKSWPYFIMGASEMWIHMLDQISREYEKQHPALTFDEQLMGYKDIYDSLTFLWQEQCGHALLHHLNALFGYVPVKVRQVDMLMRF